MSLRTVQRWLARAGEERLDRVSWADNPSRPGRTRRTSPALEELVLDLRASLRSESVLGEYGAAAIRRELDIRAATGEFDGQLPAIRTIGRILERRGALDGRRRVRRPAPPPGWYLPAVAAQRVELDSFDAIVGLKVLGGREVDVLTAISLHGGLTGAWPSFGVTARSTIAALVGHWRDQGLPAYAQFDNDTRFHGPHGRPGSLGRVTRFCLEFGVIPVFAPPYETGFQAAIESFNGRWQAKVWQRFWFETLDILRARSDRYILASRAKAAVRIEGAPLRRSFPGPRALASSGPADRIVYLRRTNEAGQLRLFGQPVGVDPHWPHRLVRAELHLDRAILSCYALRRREPTDQPLIAEFPFDLHLTPRYRHPDARIPSSE